MKYTPGPWEYQESFRDWEGHEIYHANKGIAYTLTDECSIIDEEAAANALLISAAPDLLEALEQCANWAENFTEKTGQELIWLAKVKAAIAKATNTN